MELKKQRQENKNLTKKKWQKTGHSGSLTSTHNSNFCHNDLEMEK